MHLILTVELLKEPLQIPTERNVTVWFLPLMGKKWSLLTMRDIIFTLVLGISSYIKNYSLKCFLEMKFVPRIKENMQYFIFLSVHNCYIRNIYEDFYIFSIND